MKTISLAAAALLGNISAV
jgi:hypothetical protein